MREIICFHSPDECNGYLSNWYLSNFFVDGIGYSSMEQYMMYQKAVPLTGSQALQTSKSQTLPRCRSHYPHTPVIHRLPLLPWLDSR